MELEFSGNMHKCIVSKTIPPGGLRVVALTRKLTDGLKTLFH